MFRLRRCEPVIILRGRDHSLSKTQMSIFIKKSEIQWRSELCPKNSTLCTSSLITYNITLIKEKRHICPKYDFFIMLNQTRWHWLKSKVEKCIKQRFHIQTTLHICHRIHHISKKNWNTAWKQRRLQLICMQFRHD